MNLPGHFKLAHLVVTPIKFSTGFRAKRVLPCANFLPIPGSGKSETSRTRVFRSIAVTRSLTGESTDVAREEELRIPGPAGNIRALLFAPENTAGEALPVLVYLHGGGWVILSPESHVKLTKQFAVGAGLIVVSVNYRLAPENPYRRRLTTAWPRSAGSAKTPPHSAATRRGCRSAGIRLAAAWPPRLPSGCSPRVGSLPTLCS